VTGAVFDAETAASRVVAALLPLADAERAGQAKRYLKSDLDFLGVSVPAIRSAVTSAARSHRELDRYATPMLAEKEFVKDAIQRSFREISANPERYLPVCLTYR
jgi:hypothetical protein